MTNAIHDLLTWLSITVVVLLVFVIVPLSCGDNYRGDV